MEHKSFCFATARAGNLKQLDSTTYKNIAKQKTFSYLLVVCQAVSIAHILSDQEILLSREFLKPGSRFGSIRNLEARLRVPEIGQKVLRSILKTPFWAQEGVHHIFPIWIRI